MSGDPMRLVRFVCVATAHRNGRTDAALTIHDGAWAFCPTGGNGSGHDWRPSDGLPLAEAMRLIPREPPPEPLPPVVTKPELTRTARPR
jgi:hypothetical protein